MRRSVCVCEEPAEQLHRLQCVLLLLRLAATCAAAAPQASVSLLGALLLERSACLKLLLPSLLL